LNPIILAIVLLARWRERQPQKPALFSSRLIHATTLSFRHRNAYTTSNIRHKENSSAKKFGQNSKPLNPIAKKSPKELSTRGDIPECGNTDLIRCFYQLQVRVVSNAG
jgi:hypothetical protein